MIKLKNEKFILLLITFFLTILSIDYRPQTVEDKPDAYEVIKYMDNNLLDYPNDANDFYLLFDSYKLDSKNFDKVLSFFNDPETKILEVYPYINPIYQNVLNDIYVIPYNAISLKKGIANIYNIYMNELEEYHLDDEIDKALVNGVRIRMVKVNTSNKELSSFLINYPNVKYNLTPHGLFKKYEL